MHFPQAALQGRTTQVADKHQTLINKYKSCDKEITSIRGNYMKCTLIT